ncbi:hypothetical protein TRIUR3_14843 [Triticum urartu]|uniref:Uncharacterized protein n=1 Tax=Triticum urartu TaxID=4572 RepID=M7YHH3_TRIUA|nr:hypothetical protein TRIUR3_14843 [Triticum urartu]
MASLHRTSPPPAFNLSPWSAAILPCSTLAFLPPAGPPTTPSTSVASPAGDASQVLLAGACRHRSAGGIHVFHLCCRPFCRCRAPPRARHNEGGVVAPTSWEPSTFQIPRGAMPVLLTGVLASRVPAGIAADWIHLDLGPSIPALPDALGGCSASCRGKVVTGVWGEIHGRPTAAGRDSDGASCRFHLDGVVFILRSCDVLGVLSGVLCLVMPFDYADGTQCHGLVLARRCSSSTRGAPLCDVLGVLCGVLCLVMPFNYTGGAQVSWRRLGPSWLPGTFRLRQRCSVMV